MTIGESGASDRPILVDVAIFELAMLSPGTYVMMTAPGENPSAAFCALVSTCAPFMFTGSTCDEMLSRRPVAVRAATVNASFGQGRRQ